MDTRGHKLRAICPDSLQNRGLRCLSKTARCWNNRLSAADGSSEASAQVGLGVGGLLDTHGAEHAAGGGGVVVDGVRAGGPAGGGGATEVGAVVPGGGGEAAVRGGIVGDGHSGPDRGPDRELGEVGNVGELQQNPRQDTNVHAWSAKDMSRHFARKNALELRNKYSRFQGLRRRKGLTIQHTSDSPRAQAVNALPFSCFVWDVSASAN